MQVLIDADLSPRLAALFEERGHHALHVGAITGPGTPDTTIASIVRDAKWCLVTADFDFADIREYDPRLFFGLVVLTLPRDSGPMYIERLVRYFLDRLPELGDLTGKLVIVELGRIRIRE